MARTLQNTLKNTVVVEILTLGSTIWTVPDGVTELLEVLVGGGGGGGGGAGRFVGAANRGGGGGGGSVPIKYGPIKVTPGETFTIFIGSAGVGGANGTADNTNGLTGTVGGTTTVTRDSGSPAYRFTSVGGNPGIDGHNATPGGDGAFTLNSSLTGGGDTASVNGATAGENSPWALGGSAGAIISGVIGNGCGGGAGFGKGGIGGANIGVPPGAGELSAGGGGGWGIQSTAGAGANGGQGFVRIAY